MLKISKKKKKNRPQVAPKREPWQLWLDEFVSLGIRKHVKEESFNYREENQYEYLRNLIEAALGTKSTLIEDNSRSEPRIPVVLPVIVSWENGKIEAFTVNLSWGGVQVDDSTLPKDMDRFDLHIVLEREGKEFKAQGNIIWQSREGTGIAFADLSHEQKVTLGEILSNTLRERVEKELAIKKNEKNLRKVMYASLTTF